MQKSVAFVLIIAAFLAGALADRVVRWATTPDVPAYVASAPPGPGSADEPTTWDLPGCMASASRRGMTQTEASHACQEIVK